MFDRGVGQDLKESYRWFKEASEEDTVSAAMTADMLMRGAGVPVDHGAAYVLFRRSIVRTLYSGLPRVCRRTRVCTDSSLTHPPTHTGLATNPEHFKVV